MLLNGPILSPISNPMPFKLDTDTLKHLESRLANYQSQPLAIPEDIQMRQILSRDRLFRAPFDIIGKYVKM